MQPGRPMSQRRRRQVLIAVGTVLVARGAFAQSPGPARVGILVGYPQADTAWPDLLRSALRTAGWTEGRNLVLQMRFGDGGPEGMPALVNELVRAKVQVTVVVTNREADSVLRGAPTMPVVTLFALDPVKYGYAKTLARPGGSITGLTVDPSVSGKFVQIMRDVMPALQRVGYLYPASSGLDANVNAMALAARSVGIGFSEYRIERRDDLVRALEDAAKSKVGALRVGPSAVVGAELDYIVSYAAANKLATFFGGSPISVERGGFMFYGARPSAIATRAAAFVDRILKGARPGDLSFEFPTEYDLAINLKTAQTLGITIPQSVLLQATRVIE